MNSTHAPLAVEQVVQRELLTKGDLNEWETLSMGETERREQPRQSKRETFTLIIASPVPPGMDLQKTAAVQ